MEALAKWISIVALAGFASSVVNMLCPTSKGNIEKYVKLVCSLVVLTIIISPLFSILKDLSENLNNSGIFANDDNINITENNQSGEWILSETVKGLKSGIKQLVKQKYGIDIETDAETYISDKGIEIKSITIEAEGTVYAKKLEIAQYLEEYLAIPVRVSE